MLHDRSRRACYHTAFREESTTFAVYADMLSTPFLQRLIESAPHSQRLDGEQAPGQEASIREFQCKLCCGRAWSAAWVAAGSTRALRLGSR